MTRVEVFQAQAELPLYVERAELGETIILCKNGEAVAEIRPFSEHAPTRRPVGLARGLVELPAEFFDPLPDEDLAPFAGESPQGSP